MADDETQTRTQGEPEASAAPPESVPAALHDGVTKADEKPRVNGYAIASSVVALLCLMWAFIPVSDAGSQLVFALLATASGVVGIVVHRERGGLAMAVGGVILGSVLAVTAIVDLASSADRASESAARVFDKTDLEATLSTQIENQGFDLDHVRCPSDRPIVAGTSFECGLLTTDGESAIVRVKVQDSHGVFSWRVLP